MFRATFCLCSLLFVFQNINANSIKLQIETDDLIKVLNGIMKTVMFQNFAAQLNRRSQSNTIKYNNPYHPEDDTDIVDNTQEIYERDKQKSRNLKLDDTQIFLSESQIDTENKNYILSEYKTDEDMLLRSNNIPRTNQLITDADIEKELQNNGAEKHDDMHNFNHMQKRFLLKKS